MLETRQIELLFDSLQDYEKFRLEWTSVCATLNQSEQNVNRLKDAQNRAIMLGVV